MQRKLQYEYAIVRVVPVVEREEFVNAGVILFCKKEKFIRMKYHLPLDKLLALRPDAEVEEIRKNLEAFRIIADGEKRADPLHPSTRPNVSGGSVPLAVHRYKPPCPTQALATTWKKLSITCLMKWWGNFLFPEWCGFVIAPTNEFSGKYLGGYPF